MKGMIKSSAEQQAKAMNGELGNLIKKNNPFVEQRKPVEKAVPGEPVPIDDYTSEKHLKALMAKQ